MRTITVDYLISKRSTFDIPKVGFWADWFKAWDKDEDDRTEEDYEILDKAELEDFIRLKTGFRAYDIELYDCD